MHMPGARSVLRAKNASVPTPIAFVVYVANNMPFLCSRRVQLVPPTQFGPR